MTHGVRAEDTALDRYVARPDPNYSYAVYDTQRRRGLYTAYFLRMTSQQWRSASEVDRPIWEHEVIILIPDVALDSTKTAVLLIDGGSNGGTPTTSTPELLGAASIATGAVIAAVRQVPNQPLFFPDDPGRGRKEDEILAYSLDKALDTGDLEWPVHLAMTKAAVRAMDTVQEFAASKGQDVRDFLVLGGSKRGWTTWLTAAVDPRVKAILPASIDMLNLGRQFVHQWEAYGFYAPAVEDYVEFDLPCRMQTPQGRAVLQVVDPFAYRDRYAGLPKLVLNASGDQFFVTDSSRFYFAGLPGPKWLRYTPNTDHGQNQDAIERALSWVDDILNNKASATIDWTVRGDGALRVTTSFRPKQVRLWQATNPDARDFRLESLGAAWTSADVLATSPADGAYVGFAPPPAVGWTAFFVEVTFDTAGVFKPDQAYTTDILITPDDLPFAETACDVAAQTRPRPWLAKSASRTLFASRHRTIRGWVCHTPALRRDRDHDGRAPAGGRLRHPRPSTMIGSSVATPHRLSATPSTGIDSGTGSRHFARFPHGR
ncbi:MAG: PhoPQ-activated protein PqaA family protein [Candidatus Competibacteraceae bacterium]|nr:PhoPQ-activated protein PqaA family protein [Candidatus Competibacteraceae bacterium]